MRYNLEEQEMEELKRAITEVLNTEERKSNITTIIENCFYKDFFTKEQEETFDKIKNRK